MWRSTRDQSVLKLVHPGRHMEIHRQPITAAEVMRRNPRHCIARPDVFKNPWIVVRPESVLVPGKVFYIVPTRTIYDLLKARSCNQPSEQRKYHEDVDHRDLSKQLASLKLCAGTTPKHQHHVKDRKELSTKHIPSDDEEGSWEQDSDKSLIKPSQVSSWPETNNVDRNRSRPEFNHKHAVRSTVNARPSHYRKSALLETENSPQLTRSEQINKLKSCLRKQDSVRKSNNLRVNFAS